MAVDEVHRSDEDEPDRRDEHCNSRRRIQGEDDEADREKCQHAPAHRDATRHLVHRVLVQIGALMAVHDVTDDDEGPAEQEQQSGNGRHEGESLHDRVRGVQEDDAAEQQQAGCDKCVARDVVARQFSEL